jgi:hypothetical protein
MVSHISIPPKIPEVSNQPLPLPTAAMKTSGELNTYAKASGECPDTHGTPARKPQATQTDSFALHF